jgi:hypothetical protein
MNGRANGASPGACWIYGHLLALVSLLALNGSLHAADPKLQALREAGRWKQLRAQVEPRFRENPNDPLILYWMSEVKAAFADFQGAYELARKAATAAPGDADCHRALARASGEMAQRVGLFSQMWYARECKKAGESALELNPQNLDNVEFMANFYPPVPSLVLVRPLRNLDAPRLGARANTA